MAGDFQFISVQGIDHARNKTTQNQARSHSVRKTLAAKRNHQRLCRTNFVITSFPDGDPVARVEGPLSTSPRPVFTQISGALDPFQALAVDSSRLQALLCDYRAIQAPEPVFSVAEDLAFQSFGSVFRTGFDDPALVNAIMLVLAFSAADGKTTHECLRYQGQALTYIRERMGCLDYAALEGTLGAILLITGVAARRGLASEVEMHMGAVQQLLKIARCISIHLSPGIKRAIFWQDLNSFLLASSARIVNHTTFSELLWTRDPFVAQSYRLPRGFQSRPHILSTQFSDILEDLHALQCIRDIYPRTPPKADAMRMLYINNQTALIQSRLLARSDLSPLQECCRLAAFLCSATLCCKVWCELVIPSHISSQLLTHLQEAFNALTFDEDPELLIWLLYIGGAFAPRGPLRSGYLDLLRRDRTSTRRGLPYPDSLWDAVHGTLRQFIWSDHTFVVPVRALWMERFGHCGD